MEVLIIFGLFLSFDFFLVHLYELLCFIVYFDCILFSKDCQIKINEGD